MLYAYRRPTDRRNMYRSCSECDKPLPKWYINTACAAYYRVAVTAEWDAVVRIYHQWVHDAYQRTTANIIITRSVSSWILFPFMSSNQISMRALAINADKSNSIYMEQQKRDDYLLSGIKMKKKYFPCSAMSFTNLFAHYTREQFTHVIMIWMRRIRCEHK